MSEQKAAERPATSNDKCGYCRVEKPVMAVVSTCPIHGPLRRSRACQECIDDPANRKGRHVHMVLACDEEVVLHEL